MFCYTGGFSFYAMRGGAELVHSVDSSEKAIALTRENVELNFPGDPRHEAFCEDAFKFLENSQPSYNLIILDPPAFAKHRGALHNALKGYTRLNQKAFEKIERGGILFTFSCSQVVTKTTSVMPCSPLLLWQSVRCAFCTNYTSLPTILSISIIPRANT